MSGSRQVIAVVTAKGRSRRVPGKNLRLLADAPLFCHSVRLAQRAARVDRVLVSSDSEEILSQARENGAEARLRPSELCTDTATSFAVLQHLVAELREEASDPEILVLIQPTTPFCTPTPLDGMIARMQADDTLDSLITVTRIMRPFGVIQEDGRWCPRDPLSVHMKNPRVEYALTGHIYIMRPSRTLDRGALLGELICPVELPEEWLDIDIDIENDWNIAQSVAPTFFSVKT